MTRTPPLRSIPLTLALLLACTSNTEPEVTEPENPPEARAEPELAPDVDVPSLDAELGPLVRACDGAAAKARIEALDAAALGALADSAPSPSVRWLATWERERAFDDAGRLEAGAAESVAEAIAAELGQAPPRWWVEQLATASYNEPREGPPYYDVGRGDDRDRRGPWVDGPGDARSRPDVRRQLVVADGELAIDLSSARVELGPAPTDPASIIEVARARAGTTIYYATFSQGSGGFSFPLHAVDRDGPRWTAQVCGPARMVLNGLGHLTVEIVVVTEPDPEPVEPGRMAPSPPTTAIAVFSAESHGVALDVFDPETGARTMAWSSDFWFMR